MKKLISLLLFATILLSAGSSMASAKTESLDQIIAIINDDVITRSELNTAINRVKQQINPDHLASLSPQALQKQVMDQLINKKLQLQAANQLGIEIPNREVDQAIQTVAEQNQTTVTQLYQRLSQEHLSVDEYRKEIREQMTLQKIQQQEVAGKITITPEEVNRFMRAHPWQAKTAKEYRIDDILIPLPEAPSPEAIATAREEANTVLAKLKAGESLQAIIKSKPTLETNDLGWRKLAEIPSAFIESVSTMQRHELAGPIQTPNGIHLIRLSEVRSLASKEQSAPNKKQVEELLLQQKFEEAVQNWVSTLRGQAYIVLNPGQKHDLG